MIGVTINEFVNYADMGREIEFTFFEKPLFLGPVYNDECNSFYYKHHYYKLFYIWDSEEEKEIAVADTPEKLLEIEINGRAIKSNWENVRVDYIL